jgi:hypothetical protein
MAHGITYTISQSAPTRSSQCCSIIATGIAVSREELQTFWKRLGLIRFASAEIINGHSTVGNFLKGAIGVGIVKRRGPISRLVALDLA